MYILNVPKVDQEQIFKHTTEEHNLQFQGSINIVPCLILLDTGASGTALIDRQHCVKEGIVLAPAPSGLTIVLADGSRSACPNMATIKLRLERYKYHVECLFIDHLEGYPLVLGNPWLNQHCADISYQRKQVIFRKPDGPQYSINSFIGKPKKKVEPELCAMGEVLLDSLSTNHTELLSTKQVAKLVTLYQLCNLLCT
jgi:hypothetical protein